MFKKMSIKTKLLILVIIPIIFILLVSSKSILRDLEDKEDLANLKVGVMLSTKISALVHETQKERGMTAGYIGSKGKKFVDTLPKQRALTNSRLVELKKFLSSNNVYFTSDIKKYLDSSMNDISKIQNIRNDVTSLTLPIGKALGFYTNMNAKYLDVVIAVSKVSKDPIVTKELVAYSNFLLSKERAGIERAVGTNTLAKDKFAEGMRIKLNNLIASQNSFLQNFLKYATPEAHSFYSQTLTGKDVDEVNRIRKTLLLSAEKHELVAEIELLVGYGGLIHNFKNYIIRGDKKYAQKVKELYSKFLERIKEYKAFDSVSKKEISLLEDVEEVFTRYYNGISKVTNALEEGMPIKAIDKIVKVNDTLGIEALDKLNHSLFSDDAVYWFQTITKKINLLKKVDDNLSDELILTISKKYNSANFYFYLILGFSIVFLLGLIIFSIFMLRGINTSLMDFNEGLLDFFKYLNKEKNEVSLLKDSGGEIGEMAKVVNANIQKVKVGIEEEKKVLVKTIEVLKEFEEGDLSKRVNINVNDKALDELTTLIDKMGDNLQNNIENVLKVLEEYTSYNYLNTVNSSNLKAHLHRLGSGVNNLGESITEMLVLNKKAGLTLDSSSDVLLQNVKTVNESTNQAAASLEETSAALEEITGTLVSNNESIDLMSKYAKELSGKTSYGQEQANKTMVSMDEINEQVSLINESISVIDQIAFQTNILSLNAAVEAATAGEAGKGFAVVAQEVRNLAARSAEAAKEIKDIVESANEKASHGKNIAQNMIKGYNELNENIVKTIDLISGVETSSREQQSGIQQINDSVASQDKQTQNISNAVSQTYDIAISNSEISKKIVQRANEKEFRGKDEIVDRRKKDIDKDYDGLERRSTERKIKQSFDR